MDKWSELRSLIDAQLSWDIHYSLEKPVETNTLYKVKLWMDDLDRCEKKELEETNAFLFTDVPEFDKRAWERILEEKGLQGLA